MKISVRTVRTIFNLALIAMIVGALPALTITVPPNLYKGMYQINKRYYKQRGFGYNYQLWSRFISKMEQHGYPELASRAYGDSLSCTALFLSYVSEDYYAMKIEEYRERAKLLYEYADFFDGHAHYNCGNSFYSLAQAIKYPDYQDDVKVFAKDVLSRIRRSGDFPFAEFAKSEDELCDRGNFIGDPTDESPLRACSFTHEPLMRDYIREIHKRNMAVLQYAKDIEKCSTKPWLSSGHRKYCNPILADFKYKYTQRRHKGNKLSDDQIEKATIILDAMTKQKERGEEREAGR